MMARHFEFNSVRLTTLVSAMSIRYIKPLSMVALMITMMAANARDSLAQVVPYKTMGTAGVYSPITGEYSGFGIGTHMGKHSFVGKIAVTPTANPLVFTFQSVVPQEAVSADGAKFYSNLSGQVQLVPINPPIFSARWTGQFVVVSGTDRFANVQPGPEPLQIIAVNHPFNILTDPLWKFDWEVNGQIELK
jgi:hypothetical protein